jgi:hypothetical protein
MAFIKVVSYECEAAGRLPDGFAGSKNGRLNARRAGRPPARPAAVMTQFLKGHTSPPCPVLLAHLIALIFFYVDPLHIIWNGHDLQLSAMAIGFAPQLLHLLDKQVVIAGSQQPAFIEAWPVGTRGRGPVRSSVNVVQRIWAPQLSEPKEGRIVHADPP